MNSEQELLREEFSRWLSDATWTWTTYATLTFERPMLKDALRWSKVWMHSIARTAPRVWGFSFQETHLDGQRLHVHSLLCVKRNLIDQPSNRDMWYLWFRSFGRALIVDYNPSYGTGKSTMTRPERIIPSPVASLSRYLTKYVLKEGSGGGFDWDFNYFADGKELDKDTFSMHTGRTLNFPEQREK